MAAPDKVKKLVDDFERLKGGRAPESFDEAQLRVSYINPFWEALGWNVRDHREVVIEKVVAMRHSTKRADYCFLLNGRPAFVLETKDFRKRLDDPDIVFQLNRYGYNLRVDFGFLTNFAELQLYETWKRPLIENPIKNRVKKFHFDYQEYVARWDELEAALAREAVAAGALNAFLTKKEPTRNKEAVDRKFFERLNEWRAELARVIALRNPDLTVHDINEAVQRLLDRAIFMRVIEDRGIEATELLLDALNRWKVEGEKPLYRYVVDKFRYLEPQYNGELFEKHFSEQLLVDDKPLKDFIESVYYPKSPYQFNVVGVEMLGTIYERFLGSTIRLTPSHRAVVEEKPEVRKAGGVYYTPKYIVDYIVENTVGELLKKCKTPAAVAKLKILDPACGSGSFLLGAFHRLIDWHEDYFTANPDKIGKGLAAACWRDADEEKYRLTARFKGQILVNNIFGVDIDPQACEVTRMSLYLKILESVNVQYLMKTALLPQLDANIKCGNSLIGSDYWDFVREKQGELFERTEKEERRVNPFDWEVEFAAIMKAGGFDAVIGNPPYVRQEVLSEYKEYFARKYDTFTGTTDLYVCFIEKALTLTKEMGRFSFIVSNKWTRARYGAKLRAFVKGFRIEKLVDFGELPVFQGAATFPLIIVMAKAPKRNKPIYAPIKRLDFEDLTNEVKAEGYALEDGALADAGFSMIKNETLKVVEKMKAIGLPLGEYVGNRIYYGIKTGLNEAFIIDAATRVLLIREDESSQEIIKPFVVGDDVRKYRINFRERYLIFTRRGIEIDVYPAIKKYLSRWREELTPKKSRKDNVGRKPGNYAWYEIQDTVDYFHEFKGPKIIFPDIAKASRFGFSQSELYFTNTCYFIPKKDHLLLGFLNSRLLWFYYQHCLTVLGDPRRGGRLRFFDAFLVEIPIRIIDFSNPADVARHDKMVALVEEMLALHKRLAAAKSDADKKRIQRAVDASDRKIDTLVYELYGLTDEEIKIVEEGC